MNMTPGVKIAVQCSATDCRAEAAWKRCATLLCGTVYLCDDHFLCLMQERPKVALHYAPLYDPPSVLPHSLPTTSDQSDWSVDENGPASPPCSRSVS